MFVDHKFTIIEFNQMSPHFVSITSKHILVFFGFLRIATSNSFFSLIQAILTKNIDQTCLDRDAYLTLKELWADPGVQVCAVNF